MLFPQFCLKEFNVFVHKHNQQCSYFDDSVDKNNNNTGSVP